MKTCLHQTTHLASIQHLAFGIIGEEKHVDEVNEKARRVPGVLSIVSRPFIEDENDQIAK